MNKNEFTTEEHVFSTLGYCLKTPENISVLEYYGLIKIIIPDYLLTWKKIQNTFYTKRLAIQSYEANHIAINRQMIR